ncbi:MAG: LacI family DNA-binding transcriptional regulator [Anaerocolumna sp.]
MKKKAKDIARELGISTATVSLALNNKPGVNEQTRNKVLSYIKESQENVENGKERKEKTIRMYTFIQKNGQIDAEENTRFYMGYAEASRRARAAGYKMDIVFVDSSKDDFVKILNECEEDVAGVYLNAAYMTDEDYQCLRGFNLPYVVCDQDFNDMHTDSIVLNNQQGVRTGLKYLYENGHRDIMYLRNSKDFYNMYERRSACNSFMNEKRLQQADNERIMDIGSSTQEIYDNMYKYIKNNGHIPTAIFAENYEATIGVSRALQSCGYRIPNDVSIVGFDEIPGAAILDFQPTFLRALHGNVANMAVGRLLERIKRKAKESVQILVSTEFVIGNSVKRI